MNATLLKQATAFAMAAMVTCSVLAGLNGLAASQLASAHAQLALAPSTSPA